MVDRWIPGIQHETSENRPGKESSMDREEYIEAFLDESWENLRSLSQGCLRLERGEGSDDLYAEMFRIAHTLKGMSASIGFSCMANLTHHLEDVLSALRSREVLPDAATADVLLAVVAELERQLDEIRATGLESPEHYQDLITRLDKLVSQSRLTPPALAGRSKSSVLMDFLLGLKHELETCWRRGDNVWLYTVEFDASCLMKGARTVLVACTLEKYGRVLASHPTIEAVQSQDFDGPVAFVLIPQLASGEALTSVLEQLSEVAQVTGQRLDRHLLADLQPADPQGGNNYQGIAQSGTPDACSKLQLACSKVPGLDENRTEVRPRSRTVRVRTDTLDEMVRLVTEMVINEHRLLDLAERLGSDELTYVAEQVRRLVDDLQTAVFMARTAPVQILFERFPRLIRDLGKTLNKDIRLVCTGEETTFDRSTIDELGQILLHLLRNAADHGLESPIERTRLGKAPYGTITLNAYAVDQYSYIEVSDDGRGIDPERIRRRAVERGLLHRPEAERLTVPELFDLLFVPGFSTAEQISEISGRGVGLDVVREKVEALGGKVTVESRPHNGTTFQIRLPSPSFMVPGR
ncbi:MAG: chemotaxis protein CheA [Alicyclobacillus sp.]|nr:chemotaxis protein CheA [Alicyclobacillus sp.]